MERAVLTFTMDNTNISRPDYLISSHHIRLPKRGGKKASGYSSSRRRCRLALEKKKGDAWNGPRWHLRPPQKQKQQQQPGCRQNHGSTLLLEGNVLRARFQYPSSTSHTHENPLISLGGMCGAVVTSPFDVVKTRLQSDLFRQKHAHVDAVVGDSVVLVRRPGGFLWHFVETAHIIRLRCVSPLCSLFTDMLMTKKPLSKHIQRYCKRRI